VIVGWLEERTPWLPGIVRGDEGSEYGEEKKEGEQEEAG
jgi:hypothetical protein